MTNILTEATMNNEKKVVGVETQNGAIKTSVVVNTCGSWSQYVSQMVGLNIPLTSMKHGYVVTGSVPGLKGSPQVRDQDGNFYFRPQGEAVIIGMYEHNPVIINEVEKIEFSNGISFFILECVLDTNGFPFRPV